jgi:SAM-dependent methyltransferase
VNPKERRRRLLAGLNVEEGTGLEIGPLCSPLVTKDASDVYYVDHLSTEGLIEKYREDPAVHMDQIVPVDFISEGDLAAVIPAEMRFDWVVASHVVEHVPDLIGWLGQLHSVLAEGGELCLVVPDRRYTFDYKRSVTTLAEALATHALGATRPMAQAVVDQEWNAARIGVKRAWRGAIKPSELPEPISPAGAMALGRSAEVDGVYRDVHVSVFTPKSFARLMGQMTSNDLLSFGCARFVDTPRDELEFYVRLYPESDRSVAAASWKKMAEEARLGPRIKNVDDIMQADYEDQLRHLSRKLENIEKSRSWKAINRARQFKGTLASAVSRKPKGNAARRQVSGG